jgi:hypothetical protein
MSQKMTGFVRGRGGRATTPQKTASINGYQQKNTQIKSGMKNALSPTDAETGFGPQEHGIELNYGYNT